MATEAEPIICHSYGHAHKHPAVIGKIAGWTLPTPVTPTQLGVFVGSFVVLLATHRIWGAFLPGAITLIVLGGVPITLAWIVRHLRLEGRSPVQMASGLFSLAMAPRTGALFGRTYRGWRRDRSRGGRVFVAAGPPLGVDFDDRLDDGEDLGTPVAPSPVGTAVEGHRRGRRTAAA